MGPKKRVSVAERQQRSNAASTSKKRPATAFTHTIISTRKAFVSAGNTTSISPKKSNLKQTTSPAKKTLKFADKDKEAVQFETILEKTERNKCEKFKVEEKKRASSRENVNRATPNLRDKTSIIKKEDSVILETSSNSCASTASSSNCSATSSIKIGGDKSHDKKDEKTKAISKMLKSLDIKISGFDNILPKNEIIADLGLKSSISENVKTKSRAAAVKVIANMSPPKPMKRTKNDEEKKKLTQKQQEQQYKNIIQYREKETCEKIDSTKNKNHEVFLMEETDMNEVVIKEEHETVLSVIENKKKLAIKKAKTELNEQKGSKKIQTVKMKKRNHRNDNDLVYEDQLIKEMETKSSNTAEDVSIGKDKKIYAIPTALKSPKSITTFNPTDCKYEMDKEKDGGKPKNEITLSKIDSNVGKNNRNSKILNTTMLNKKLSDPKSLTTDQIKNTRAQPLLEEKEEILKVVLDANTEVIQMEIEEISSNVLKKGTVESTEIKCPQIIFEGNKGGASHQSRGQGSIVQDDSKKLIIHLKEKRIPNIKHRLQAKFKANPNKTKMSITPIKKTSTITKLLAQTQTQTPKSDPNKEGSKDDIYDFKSGSEEEEFIKMDLPTLKDLREFSEEDNEPLKASPKRGTPKFSGFRDKLKKDAQQEANTHKEDSQKQQKADKNTLIIDCKHSKEKTLPQKLSKNKANTTTKKLFKTKVANIKTKKQKNLKQKEKVSKIVKGRYAKKDSKSNEKSENDASEYDDGLTSESNDSEDEQKLSMFGQKRQRMASLNALAKVQCLYENESRTAYELGLSKATLMPPKIRTVDGSDDERDKEKDKVKEKDVEKAKAKEKDKLEKDKNLDNNKDTTKEKSKLKKDHKVNEDPLKIEDAPKEGSEDEPVEELKRELRNVFGGRGLGKHWELDSDSEAEEAERLKLKKKKLQKKMQIKKEKELEKEKAKERIKDAEDKIKGETIMNKNKNKEPIKIKRKYTKIKKPLRKLLKLAMASSEDDANSAASENGGGNNKDDDPMHKSKLETKKPPKKRKRIFKEDLIGDYKGILARKRMASLNATAIVAATYEVERHLDKNLESECSSYDGYEDKEKTTNKKFKDTAKYIVKEHSTQLNSTAITKSNSKELPTSNNCMLITTPPTKTPPKIDKPQNICDESNDSKYSKETKETNTDATTTTSTITGNATSSGTSKDSSRPTSSSVVIVQDTDVTITGVYVNSSAGSGQEAYCKMQYRVQSSVTEERLLRPGSADPPPKSYTPLSALSSMLPPGASAGVTSAVSESHSASTSPLPSGNNTQQPSNIPHVDVINPVAALYHSADLGIHTELPSTEQHHGPPPPSYAAAAAYHVHHLSPQATPHHQHQYAHAHAHHQYQQATGGEHHGMPPPPHHYVSARPTPHYGPPPLPGSPPPTYRASNAYPTHIPAPHPPPSVGGSGAFCPTNSHPMQQHQALSSVTSLPTSSTTQISTLQQHHQQQLSGQSTSNERSGEQLSNTLNNST